MIQSIFYKEWLKTRRSLCISMIVFAVIVFYVFVTVQQMFRINGATAVWTEIIMKDINVLSYLKWIPVFTSVFFAISQFLPEINSKRLKLTLHLPMSENSIMFSLLSFGSIALLAIYSIVLLVLYLGLTIYFPVEIVLVMVKSTIPWFLAGLVSYYFVAWICIEPVWKQRICNFIIACCTITCFMLNAKSGAYSMFISYLIVIVLISYFFSYYSMFRFKDGIQ